MNKYLLRSEQQKINQLITLLSQKLNQPIPELTDLKKQFLDFIRNTKDNNIDDIMSKYFDSLQLKMEPIFTANITPGVQFGIQNDTFKVIGYGGTYNNIENKPIEQDTFFSFDSISKTLTSLLITQEIKKGNLTWNTTVNDYNPEFAMDATIESILKFTAKIKTAKRIDYLSQEETIQILKACKENLEEKNQYKNFYEYNDLGFMIFRLSIPEFLSKIDNLLNRIDSKNLTYDWHQFKSKITGGKISEEYITPDLKGRDILFPGHTGLYGNIEGLLNLLEIIYFKDTFLTTQEKDILLKQPYADPNVYDKNGNQQTSKNKSPMYTTKVAGVYRQPTGITNPNYNKLESCFMSHHTTEKALISTGTCGSWVVGDSLSYQDKFNYYVGGILTNPYSYIKQGLYPNEVNPIPNTNLTVNQKGTIIRYPEKLNHYKEAITEYGLLLELLTQYLKETNRNSLPQKKYQLVKKIS